MINNSLLATKVSFLVILCKKLFFFVTYAAKYDKSMCWSLCLTLRPKIRTMLEI